MASHFKDTQRNHQITWRRANISTKNYGVHNGARYAHVLPRENWRENLWAEIRKELEEYIIEENIQAHTGTHNLLSSWVNCANLYFPVRLSGEIRKLMLMFLNTKLGGQILSIDAVELEFALKGDLSPEVLLGETGGRRGTSQTSPDVAYLVTTRKGKGIILIESKYTEHSFYRCSARTTKRRTRKPANPDITRCMQQAAACDYAQICHQTVWGRRYWDHLTLSEYGKHTLTRCPAATSGYQLFRQQSLAEGIAKSGEIGLVVSAVAHDSRNHSLIYSGRSSGVEDFRHEWGRLFTGKSRFVVWSHQEWVDYGRYSSNQKAVKRWTDYLADRYGF